jgi:2-oxo-4-hydroxy-4-carboxy--5-ureidoimidazoline (OHCU) decarboxylase
MRELPRQLSADELAALFEGRTRFVERLATEPDPLVPARTLVHELPADEQREVLDAHPAIGQRAGLSARAAAEQGADAEPAVLDELARLNAAYEARHGFRFVVFVNGRPKAAILDVLRARIGNPTPRELATAVDELVSIAEARWRSSPP